MLFLVVYIQTNLGSENCNVLFPISTYTNDEIHWGYIDSKGKIVAQPKFDSALDFQDGVGIVFGDQKSIGFGDDGHGIFAIESGIMDINGKVVLLPNTIILSDFSEGLAFANIGEKLAFINKAGKSVIPIPESVEVDTEAPVAFGFDNGIAGINTKNGVCLVNKNGEFNCRKHILGSIGFLENAESVLVKDGFTIINNKGHYLVSPQKKPISFSEGGFFITETEDGKTQYINVEGKKVLEVSYDYSGFFFNGLAVIKTNDKWGYINKQGKVIIQPKFEDAYNFGLDGLAGVKLNNKYGFIDKNGKFVIPPIFDYVLKPFNCGLAYVQQNGQVGYIDKNGKWIWSRKYL